MAVIDHGQGIEFVCQVADAFEVCDRAVHGEHAVGHDQADVGILRRFELRPQVSHVVVGIAVTAGLAQADAVDDAGVVERIADDGVIRTQQRLEQAAVRVEARWIQDSVLGAEERADAVLERLVDRLCAADESHRRHSVAILVERFVGSGNDFGVIGQSEVVIGAEIQDLSRITV